MKRYTLLYIVGVLCTFMNLSWAYASNPVKEGNVITGHVIEKGSEAGIAYATVLIVETGKGTVTNDEGYFRFKDIPAGEYTLKVQMMGYATQTKRVTVSKEFTVDMHFVMEEDVIQVDEVVVSANRNETSRKLAPVVVNVMNNRLFEIVKSGQIAQLPVRSARGKQLSELWFPASPHQWSGRPLFADPYQQPSGDERLVGCIRTGADSGEYD